MTNAGWTAEKPKMAGWYWWRDKDKRGKVRFCVCQEVYILHGSLFAADCGYLDKLSGEWLGPITPDSYQQGRVAGIGECKDLVDSFAEAYLLASMVAHSLSPEIHKCIAKFVSSIGGEIAKLAQQAQDEKGGGMASDNLDREVRNDHIITGPRPLLVCPVCGPKTMMYAGSVIAKTCAQCEQLLREAK